MFCIQIGPIHQIAQQDNLFHVICKGREKMDILGCVGIPLIRGTDCNLSLTLSFSLEVILSFQMIAFERSCSFISWEVVTGVQRVVRVRKDDFLRSEQTSCLLVKIFLVYVTFLGNFLRLYNPKCYFLTNFGGNLN